jgi:hypothetical protein
LDYQGNIGGTVQCSGWDKNSMVGAVSYRTYNAGLGVADWTQTDGDKWGPNVTDNQPLLPMGNTFCIKPNRWIRYYFLNNQQENDYDEWSAWVGDEQTNPVKILDAVKLSNNTTGQTMNSRFWFEFNDSYSLYMGGSVTQYNPLRDLVGYLRNFAVIKDPMAAEYGTPGSGLLEKPLP